MSLTSPLSENSSSLLDVQGLEDQRGVTLNQVGVKDVAVPIRFLQKDGQPQPVQAKATLSVGLPAEFKGTHMSRFVIQMTEWSRNHLFTLDLQPFLQEMKGLLEAPSAFVDLEFQYFMDKIAPVSRLSAPMAFPCELRASLDIHNHYQLNLVLTIPCATLCPCSKAISDYGAHNQRAQIHADIQLAPLLEKPLVWIEDLIQGLEETSSCPVYPIIKRSDEKFITEKAYNNPKFVEDVIREATLFLRQHPGIVGFSLEVEALESIHAHNAWASHTENWSENRLQRS